MQLHRIQRRWLLPLWLMAICLSSLSAHTFALNLQVSADKSVVAPGEIALHRFVVTNTDGVDRTNVQLNFTTPSGLTVQDGAAYPVAVSGCSFSCESGETGTMALGTMPAGSSKVIFAAFVVNAGAAPGSDITLTGQLSRDGEASAGSDSETITVQSEPAIDLRLSAERQLVSAGSMVTYEVAYGNVGSSGLVATEVRADLPDGTSFVSASDSGSLEGSQVVWSTGVVNGGESGKRYFTVEVDAGVADGSITTASAQFSSDGDVLNAAEESQVVRSDVDLTLSTTLLQDVVDPSSYVDFRYVVANSGATSKTDVTLTLKADEHLRFADGASQPAATGCSFTCGDNTEDWAVYNLGELAAGESRVVTVQMYRNNVVTGEVLAPRAFLTEGSGDYTQGQTSTVLVDDEETLNLVVGASRQVVAESETYEYELSFGNVSDSAYQNLEMELDLPEGTSFVSATDGGSHAGGTVTWDLATLNAGANSKRYVTVQAPESAGDGEVLKAQARLHTGDAPLVRSGESQVIRSGVDLTLTTTVLQDVLDPGSYVDFRYVVANTGATSKTDVTLTLKADQHLLFADGASQPAATGCSFTCGDNAEDWGVFNLGELAAGESRVVTVQMYRNNVVTGEVLAPRAFLTEGSGNYTQGQTSAVLVDDEETLNLVVGASRQVVAESETYEYELSFGNVSDSAYQNLEMELDLPEGTSFVSATDGGNHEGGRVSWDLATLNAGASSKRYVTVQAPEGAGDGEVLKATARLHTGAAPLVRSGETQVIRSGLDLSLNTTVLQDVVDTDSTVDFRYVIANTGATSKTDVTLTLKADAHLRFADGASQPAATGCSFTCGDNTEDWAVYDLGELAAGESRVVTVQMYRNNVVTGEVLAPRAFLTEGSGDYTQGQTSTVLVDDEETLNLVVGASRQVVAESETYEYELSFGNVSDSAYQNLEMELDLPEGTSFVSATDGGNHEGGRVSWDLATLNAGASSKRYVTVQAPEGAGDGEVLKATARLHTGAAPLVRAGESQVIRSDTALTLDVSTALNRQVRRFVVTNQGDTSRADVTLTVKADAHLNFNDGGSIPAATGCSFRCGDSMEDWAVYALGELAPGESRAVTILMFATGAIDGELLVTRSYLSDGENTALLGHRSTVGRNTDPHPYIAVESSDFIVAPGAEQTFTVAVGNPAGQAMSNAVMMAEIPEGFAFVSASGVAEQVGDHIVWPLGNLAPNAWRNETFVLSAAADLNGPHPKTLRALLKDDSSLSLLSDASITMVSDTDGQPALSWQRDYEPPLNPTSEVTSTLSVNNNAGTQVADVQLRLFEPVGLPFRVSDAEPPAGGCSFSCTGGSEDWASWNLGNLDAGAESIVSFPSVVSNGVVDGDLLVAHSVLKHSSSNRHDYLLQKTLGLGTEYSVDPDHDSDADGIPDWWELRWGYDRLDESDALLDMDDDGSQTLEEFQEQTDPTDPDTDGDGILDGPDDVVGDQPPVANAGPDADALSLTEVTLDGTGSNQQDDPDGTSTLTFFWSQDEGTTVTLTGASTATPTFTAPDISGEESLVFTLTVEDATGNTDTDKVTITVKPDEAPIANAGADQPGTGDPIFPGDEVTLNGSNSSDDFDSVEELTFSWVELSDSGVTLSDASAVSPTFIAPDLGDGGALTFELTVTDTAGQSSTDTVIINLADLIPPVAAAGPDKTVGGGQEVTLDASNSTDSDGEVVEFLWAQTAGPDVTLEGADTETASFVAPDGPASLEFELTVTDNHGQMDSDRININVAEDPVANCVAEGPSSEVPERDAEGALSTVNLTGTNSSISDGEIDSYVWTIVSGPDVTLSSPNQADTRFTVPEVASGTSISIVFELTCTSDLGTVSDDTVTVNIGDVNRAPQADAGADQEVFTESDVCLDGSASSDPDGQALNFNWSLISASNGATVTLDDPTAETTCFTTPAAGGESLQFELTVTDGDMSDTDTVTINVVLDNDPPTASAGEDQTVEEGSTVTLDASASSDPEEGDLTYAWQRTSGPSVTLESGSSATPSFVAPEVDEEGAVLEFEVTVTDDAGLTSSDSVTITVENIASDDDDGDGDDDTNDDDNGSGDDDDDSDNGGTPSPGGGSSGGGGGGGSTSALWLFMLLLIGLTRRVKPA